MMRVKNDVAVGVERIGRAGGVNPGLRWWLGFVLVALIGVGVAAYAVATQGLGLLSDADEGPLLANIVVWPQVLAWHAIAGAVAPVTALWQWWAMRGGVVGRRHKYVGRVYGIAVLVSGVAGLWIAPWAEGGWMGRMGFGTLAVVWLAVTGWGVWAAWARDFAAHRRWMVRSFALTCAGITLRIQLGVCLGAGYEFGVVYPWIAWACWVPNLILAEAWLRKK
jgi:hypothetical protein